VIDLVPINGPELLPQDVEVELESAGTLGPAR
jgi:hypothetical protein